jgi:NADH dehydrogenase
MEKVPFLNYREVLVTGGTGFLGRHVCRALIARGYLPRLLVRVGSEDRIPEDIRRACRVTPGDVTNREFVEMWGISRFVHVSALGASPHGPGNYFSSKGKAEEIVRQSGLSWTIFRPSGIVGPGDQFLTELGRAVRRAPFLPIPGDGEFLLQPVFVGDVVKGITDCLKRPDTEKREFEVGGPERITYNALIDRIAAAQGVRVRKVHIPLPRFRRIVGFFSRFEKFPLTPDMLEVLLAGNTCERDPFFSTFGIDPLEKGSSSRKAA